MVLDYLDKRKSDYNPWIAADASWFNQTDKNGEPIIGEAATRLLECARKGITKVNSTLRLTPLDKVKLIVYNQFEMSDLRELLEYLAVELNEQRNLRNEASKLFEEIMARDSE
ncbi:hypothetical protein [Phocaeicola sartorii]|uniref:hypothetical protein n=1 Tax=Phocaeicola sartorii TaxID=671267 RepID=UPI002430854F|nr:hypothetical protein [Phocaeicola sartorii]